MALSHSHGGLCGPACAGHQSYRASPWHAPRFPRVLALAADEGTFPGDARAVEVPEYAAHARYPYGDYDHNRRGRKLPLFATSALDTARAWFGRHWLAVINGIVATFIGVAVLTPVAYALGFTGPASTVFGAYRVVCAQTPSHSFFIGGYQCCLCARCLSIYCALLLGGLLLARFRQDPRFARPLSWKLWLLAMVPMALDGGTQLFGWRESNAGLRILTGVIFGLATAWFMLPQIEAAARPSPTPAWADGYWSGDSPARSSDGSDGEAIV